MANVTVNSYIPINWENITNVGDFLIRANQTTGSYLFTMIDFLVVFIIFITLAIGFGWESALITSAFIGLMLSILFLYMDLVSFPIVGIFVGLIIIMIMYIIWSNRYD